ncbi:polysaccharide lyase family 1 protein [Actinophytocola sp.]|uniref:pectate lyase family protein n=1 Tax=Actinophytocola sp. TaxID=1872138 RepID=UPI003899E105
MRKTVVRRGLAGIAAVAAASALTMASGGVAHAVGTPTGFGAGTTGGGNAAVTTVTTGSALVSAMKASGAAVIRVQGMVSFTGMQDVASNKTIIGVGASSGIQGGGGLDIDGATNVIIQNLNLKGGSDDLINVQDSSTKIWIDHNTFNDSADGALDIKRGSDFITVSFNKFQNHDKTMLLGHSDDNGSQDRGHLRVTYHHNWFAGTTQRHPRVRFGNPVHVYNNYYQGVTSYGVASTMEAGVLVEANYFENTNRACDLGQGDSPAGNLVQRNNTLVGSGACANTGTGVNAIPYSYTAESASAARTNVINGAGAGKIA